MEPCSRHGPPPSGLYSPHGAVMVIGDVPKRNARWLKDQQKLHPWIPMEAYGCDMYYNPAPASATPSGDLLPR
jgi:hypothetical protein